MDFGSILDDWEKIKREHKESIPASPPAAVPPIDAPQSGGSATKALESWLAENGVSDKDAESGGASSSAERSRESRRLAALKAQAVLDLHGLTGEEAESAVAAFLETSSRMGLEKVLVIHGKGLHSSGTPVLKRAVRRAFEAHPAAGRFGEADRTEGGSGAMWVLLRKKSGA
jgi:DNA-nicking Smr family endonuclease